MLKKLKPWATGIAFGGFALALAAGFAFLVYADRGGSDVDYVPGEEAPLTQILGLPDTVKIVQSSSGVYADFSFDDFCKSADLTCRGKYLGCSDPFMIDPVNDAEPMYFTDYYFAVEDVYDGTLPGSVASAKQRVLTVRQQGGVGELVAMVNESAAEPVEGVSYLLFLYSIEDGAEYNTEGDHFYLMSGMFGAWPLSLSGSFVSPNDGEAVAEEAAAESVEKAVSAASTMATGPVVTGKDAYVAEIEHLYLEGEISEEDYDAIMSDLQKEATSFARVMTDAEAKAYEESAVAAAQLQAQ